MKAIHGKNIKIFAGNSHRKLAKDIAARLNLPLGNSEVKTFSDGEICVNINETVRGSDVFVLQSTSMPVNEHIMELLIMIDAFKRASAARITAVIPYFGYARQDRKAKARDPISAKLVADLITTAGADRVLTIDLNIPQLLCNEYHPHSGWYSLYRLERESRITASPRPVKHIEKCCQF